MCLRTGEGFGRHLVLTGRQTPRGQRQEELAGAQAEVRRRDGRAMERNHSQLSEGEEEMREEEELTGKGWAHNRVHPDIRLTLT